MSEKHYPYIGGAFDRIVFDGDGSVWVKERTCKPIWDEDGFACNKCGYWWPLKHYDNGKPRYCPNCGAKVVE